MIAIIDYGLSNLLSIQRAVSIFDEDYCVTSSRDAVRSSDRIILPGVGAFGYGMDRLDKLGLSVAIREKAEEGTPILGICLGMQMLLDKSEEGGSYAGLGLIKGVVSRIPDSDIDNNRQDVPHIGWERLEINNRYEGKYDIFKHCDSIGEAYFIHSYEAVVEKEENLVSTVVYGGRKIAAIIQKDGIVGCQFHPEKSAEFGLDLIKAFITDFR